MATVVTASEHFSATQLGNAMAHLWNLDGLLLRMGPFENVDGERCICPMTLAPITNPGLVQDGRVYQFGFIHRWLQDHDTSPWTNLPLQDNIILKLSSSHDVFDRFLTVCRTRQGAARAQLERSMEPAAHGTLRERREKLEKLDSYNTDVSRQLEAWTQHCHTMRATAVRFRTQLQTFAAGRLQSLVRSFLVRTRIATKRTQLANASRYLSRVFAGYYRKAAVLQLQRGRRTFLARGRLLHEQRRSRLQLRMSEQLLKATRLHKPNNVSLVGALLDRNADVNHSCRDTGNFPLLAAAEIGDSKIVRVLCEAGAEKGKAHQQRHGAAPLIIASLNGHLEVVQALLAAGASKDQAMNDGVTPLFMASHNGHLEVVQALLAAGASKDKASNSGRTPLFVASQQRHSEVVHCVCSFCILCTV